MLHARHFIAVASVLFLCLNSFPIAALPAFPGAEGFGANALGGRGGDVYYVTNLKDDGSGSLRDGIASASGPRTILFKVSGTIRLKSDLSINKPQIMVAGQSAPGDGICVADNALTIDASDVIVRHIRSRLGSETDQQEDAISINGGTNVIVDHCSASWSVDETLSAAGYAEHVTVQWCYIAESLNQSVHKKGAHGYGSLIRPRRDASYSWHHNLYAHHSSRNPRPGTYNAHLLRLDFRNNAIYDWGFRAGYDNFPDERVEMNYVNNYLVAGPSTSWFDSAFDGSGTNTIIYQCGNRFDIDRDGLVDGTNSGWAMFSGKFTKAEVPFSAPEIYTDPADVAYERVLAHAGALPWRRDPVDAHVMATVRTQTGKIINTTADVGGWPALKSEEPPADTDNDGMPDYWERTLGLNPNNADDRNAISPSGYTQLEEYLNWLAAPHAVGESGKPVEIDLHQIRGGSTNLSFKVAGATNGKLRLLKDGHTAHFEPAKKLSGLAKISFTAREIAAGANIETIDIIVLLKPDHE